MRPFSRNRSVGSNFKPRQTGNQTVRRPNKSQKQSSFAELSQNSDNEDLINLREELLETHNFDNVNLSKLLRLQQTMDPYIHNCFMEKNYSQAKNATILKEEIDEEISRQAQILEDHQIRSKVLSNYQNAAKPKYVILLYNFSFSFPFLYFIQNKEEKKKKII